jgi:predicted nucleotidyltransferase
MEFKVHKRPRPNTEKFSKDHIDIAYKFSEKAYKEFGTFIKCIVLFGSATREKKPVGDIDILIIIDDMSIELRPEVVQTYRIIVQKLVTNISSKLHITTLKLTSFWEFVKAGDPVAVNILRDGVALIDTGIFDPLQMLLRQGRIRPTPEAVWSYFVRAPATLQNSKWHILQAVVDLYWAVVDAAHAALMRVGEVPPSPKHVPALMEEVLVKRKLCHKKYPLVMKNFYELMKRITHRQIKDMRGLDYDRYSKEAEDFINEMKHIVESKIDTH